jgi:hypothetical protein
MHFYFQSDLMSRYALFWFQIQCVKSKLVVSSNHKITEFKNNYLINWI